MENLTKIINVGSWINLGPGKIDKKNKQNVQTYIKTIKIFVGQGKNSKI